MKKSKYLRLLVLVMICSCESPNENSINIEQYFPLEIGNTWYYNTESSDTNIVDEVMKVISKIDINDTTYYEVKMQNLLNNSEGSIYYRMNGDTLFSRVPTHSEIIIADFSLEVNDIAYWEENGDLVVTQKSETIITFEQPFSVDYGTLISFKKGVGMTKLVVNGYILIKKQLV